MSYEIVRIMLDIQILYKNCYKNIFNSSTIDALTIETCRVNLYTKFASVVPVLRIIDQSTISTLFLKRIVLNILTKCTIFFIQTIVTSVR